MGELEEISQRTCCIDAWPMDTDNSVVKAKDRGGVWVRGGHRGVGNGASVIMLTIKKLIKLNTK